MKAIAIILKYEGKCLVCGKAIQAGNTAIWQKGVGVAHPKHFSVEELKRDGLLSPYATEKREYKTRRYERQGRFS